MTEEKNFLDQSLPNPAFEAVLSFNEFSQKLRKNFSWLRDHRQIFYDMIIKNIGQGVDEYPDDPESVGYVKYNADKLFEEGFQFPFVSDRLFINRLARAAETIKSGKEPNRGLVFVGPTGAGKSRFLENILKKFEDYVNCRDGCLEGLRYFAKWVIDMNLLDISSDDQARKRWIKARYRHMQKGALGGGLQVDEDFAPINKIEIPCPNRCNPILMIPRESGIREKFLKNMFQGNEDLLHKLFCTPEYSWVLNNQACPICSSIRYFLWQKKGNLNLVMNSLFAKAVKFDRRLGEGISMYNPGDVLPEKKIISDPILQLELDYLTGKSGQIRYVYSHLAKVSGGIYALMDIKQHNQERLQVLHNVISEGVHKIEDVEENVNTLIIGVTNLEDLDFIKDKSSFLERIEFVKMPYCLEPKAELKILESHLEKSDMEKCLPLIPEFFARAVISTRMDNLSADKDEEDDDAGRKQPIMEWLGDGKDDYDFLCDKDMKLLKMDIYCGLIPEWLFEADRKKLTASIRRKILSYSENEGAKGISGRDSIVIFHLFVDKYGKNNRLITIKDLVLFFQNIKDNVKGKLNGDLEDPIDPAFLESLVDFYDYVVLGQVRNALFDYDEKEVRNLVLHYLFCLPKEYGAIEKCPWTGKMVEVSRESIHMFQNMVCSKELSPDEHTDFADKNIRIFNTLTMNEIVGPKARPLEQSRQYKNLFASYLKTARERILSPFLKNKKFRQAVIDYKTDGFKSHDKRIKENVAAMISKLIKLYGYNTEGAKYIVLYAADNDLEKKFSDYEIFKNSSVKLEMKNALGLEF